MGFSRYSYGPVLPCWMDSGTVWARLPTGRAFSHKTNLNVSIPEQVIPFVSPSVMFCLEDNGMTYIGRSDGSISIYKPAGTGRLHGLNNWEAPFPPTMPVVGFLAFANQVEEIFLDPIDRQTIYHGKSMEYAVLPQQIQLMDLQYDRDLCLSIVQAKNNHVKSLVMQNGKEVVSNVLWSMASPSGSGDIRRFV